MNQTRTTTVILAWAVAIGVIADQLLRAEPGINITIAAALLAVAGLAMPKTQPRAPWPWLASVFFASMFAFRDTDLLAVDLLAALALASLPLLGERSIRLRAITLAELVTAPFRPIQAATLDALDFAGQVRTRMAPAVKGQGQMRGVGIGVLLSVPLVLVFGSLFASADPVFKSIFGQNLGTAFSHVAVIGVLTVASAGYLWTLARTPRAYAHTRWIGDLGGPQVQTPLLVTVALFAAFIGVQAYSLFGGQQFVETTTGLTYAEYARGGFFQLVFASMLVLPMVYYAPMLAGTLDERASRRLRLTLLAQLALTALVLVSALWRMALYIQMYGLTVDRVNSTAIMLWIAATLAIFAVTVVQGRPERAAYGSLVAAVITLGALNLANPEVLIARFNLTHQNGREIDFKHLSYLGGGAVPVLVSNFDLVPEAERCHVATRLKERYGTEITDWRSWNLARKRAHEAVTPLHDLGPCPPVSDPAAGASAGG